MTRSIRTKGFLIVRLDYNLQTRIEAASVKGPSLKPDDQTSPTEIQFNGVPYSDGGFPAIHINGDFSFCAVG